VININSIAILCGGKSDRIGFNKAFLKLNSEYLIEYVIKNAKKYFKNIFLIVKEVEEIRKIKPNINNSMIIEDTVRDKIGAIFGLFTALEKIDDEIIFVLSCDTPLLDYNIINMMFQSLGNNNAVIPRWPNGYIEPLYGIYRRDATLKILKEILAEKKYKLSYLISKLPKVLYFSTKIIEKIDPKLDCFLNINNINDYNILLKKIKAKRE
jgi:molybdopterin-guanine dinucleotide biosynthesis protein A